MVLCPPCLQVGRGQAEPLVCWVARQTLGMVAGRAEGLTTSHSFRRGRGVHCRVHVKVRAQLVGVAALSFTPLGPGDLTRVVGLAIQLLHRATRLAEPHLLLGSTS